MPCFKGVDPTHFVEGSEADPSPGTTYVSIENASVIDDEDTRKITFDVNFNPAHLTLGCSVDYETFDGTAIAGTHYTYKSSTASVAANESQDTISVVVLGATGDFTNKAFTVVLTNPTNCTIDDSTATGVIKYQRKVAPKAPVGTTPEESDGTEANKKSLTYFQGYPLSKAILYEQFNKCSSRASCTAYAAAGMMSAMELRQKNRIVRFNPDKLFSDAGGSPCTPTQCGAGTCPGYYSTRILAYLKSTGIQMSVYSSFRKISRWNQIQVSSSFSGDKATRKAELIRRIKKAVYDNGVIYVDSAWFSNWNTGGMSSANKYVMPIPNAGNAVGGHSYIIVGWKKVSNRSCFIVQHSSGRDWAYSGRAYLPFAYIDTDVSLPSQGYNWFRFFKATYGG